MLEPYFFFKRVPELQSVYAAWRRVLPDRRAGNQDNSLQLMMMT